MATKHASKRSTAHTKRNRTRAEAAPKKRKRPAKPADLEFDLSDALLDDAVDETAKIQHADAAKAAKIADDHIVTLAQAQAWAHDGVKHLHNLSSTMLRDIDVEVQKALARSWPA